MRLSRPSLSPSIPTESSALGWGHMRTGRRAGKQGGGGGLGWPGGIRCVGQVKLAAPTRAATQHKLTKPYHGLTCTKARINTF